MLLEVLVPGVDYILVSARPGFLVGDTTLLRPAGYTEDLIFAGL